MTTFKKITCLAALFLLTAPGFTYAQTKTKKQTKAEAKQTEVMNEALKQRYEKDSRFAASRRAAFNRGSWIGSKLSDLIQNWGPPNRVVEDGADGKIAVYSSVSNSSGGSYTPGYIETATNGFGQTVVTGSRAAVDTRWSSSYTESTAVYADKNGIITKVSYNFNRN